MKFRIVLSERLQTRNMTWALIVGTLCFRDWQEMDGLKNLARSFTSPALHVPTSPDEPEPSSFPGAPPTIYDTAGPVN
jgi:hypothetical protein